MSMWFRCLLWFLPFLLGGVEIRYFPTYENCSVRVARAEQVKKISLQYRAAGERVWLAAPMVVRLHDPERVYEWERPVKLNMPYQNGEWRGNITGLRENTRYETRWQIDGTVYSGSFRTADSSTPPFAETLYLEDMERSEREMTVSLKGKPDGWIRITARDPERLFTDVPHRLAYLTLENSEYVQIDHVRISGGNRYGIWLRNCRNIRILCNELTGNARTKGQDLAGRGQYIDLYGKHPYQQGALKLENVENMLIERNYIHTPAGTSHPWFFSHPHGPMAIATGNIKGGVVIRYNDFAGSDSRRYDDVIGGGSNGSPLGGFAWNCDIYGNFFMNANDDGIELDGGQSCVRLYRNRFTALYAAVSAAPCIVGPSCIFENLSHDLGDYFRYDSWMLKTHFGDTGTGRIFFYSNTGRGVRTDHPPERSDQKYSRLISRRNVYRSFLSGKTYMPDMDHDLFEDEETLKSYQMMGAEKNGMVCGDLFADEKNGNYRLRHRAAQMPGAFPVPEAPPLPFRPVAATLSKETMRFDKDSLSGSVLLYPNGMMGTFEVLKSPESGYIEVSPMRGNLTGDRISLSVRINPSKCRFAKRYSDALIIRFSNGFTRPLPVFSDLRGIIKQEPGFLTETAASLKDGCFNWEFEVPKDGWYFIFAKLRTTGIVRRLYEFSVDGDAMAPCEHSMVEDYRIPDWRPAQRKNGHSWKRYEAFYLKQGRHRFQMRNLRPMELLGVCVTDTLERVKR